MAPSTKLEDKLEGIENFQAWKYRIGLILQENDLDKYVKEEVAEPKEDEDKEKHWKDMIRAQRIITDSIKDHLIPQVSSKKTLKEMYDALARMYEVLGVIMSKLIHLFFNYQLSLVNFELKKNICEGRGVLMVS